VQSFITGQGAQSLAAADLYSLHSPCASCTTPGGRKQKSGSSGLKQPVMASPSSLCSLPAPCHVHLVNQPRLWLPVCTGDSNRAVTLYRVFCPSAAQLLLPQPRPSPADAPCEAFAPTGAQSSMGAAMQQPTSHASDLSR